jgi:hypothetical protein
MIGHAPYPPGLTLNHLVLSPGGYSAPEWSSSTKRGTFLKIASEKKGWSPRSELNNWTIGGIGFPANAKQFGRVPFSLVLSFWASKRKYEKEAQT